MAYRETYQSATVQGKMKTSLDEYVNEIKGMFVQRVPEVVCSSGVAVVIQLDVRSTSDACYFEFPYFLFDAQDGSLCARYEDGNSLLFHLQTTQSYELPNTTFDNTQQVFGGNLVCQRDLSVYTLNPPITTDEDSGTYVAEGTSLLPIGSVWGAANEAISTRFAWDPINDVICMVHNQSVVNVYKASDQTDLRTISCAGDANQLYPMNPPYALAFSQNSVVTQFNYLTGQVMAVGKLPDLDTARGVGLGEREWGYDRYNHRILICDQSDQDTDGTETIRIRGFCPIPLPYTILPPMVNKEPRVNRSVKVWTRVIGNGGEGIGNAIVTFTDQTVGDVAPIEVRTDFDGYAVANYDGLTTGGAETITVSVERIDDIFPFGSTQGTGGAGWTPNVHLPFTSVQANVDVSSIITQQSDWSQGTAYGTEGDTVTTRTLKASSAELTIQSGTTGETGTASNGTFGGDLVMDLSGPNIVPWSQKLWCGAWVRFPTGFDFTATNGLRLFQIRDNVSTFSGVDDDVVIEVRLKHTAGAHTGYTLEWPNKTVTDTRHDFLAHSSVLTSVDTWHWIQYYCLYTSSGAAAVQRLWVDDLIVWELAGTAAQYRDTGGAGSLTSFTANEVIAPSRSIWTSCDELRVFRNWEGNAPSDQTCYVSDVVWTRDSNDALALDENSNKYISTAYAESL